MKKIFIYGRKEDYPNYTSALEGVGIEYICSENTEDSKNCNGLLLTGGADINPRMYGCENMGSEGINDVRDKAETILIRDFYKNKKPIFGICRGHQMIAVHFGAKMIQHVENAEKHKSKDGIDSVHTITAKEGSWLSNIYGDEFSVNSAHHQAVESVPAGFSCDALSHDGLVEAMSLPQKKIYSVQFHPERIGFANRRSDAVNGELIFEFWKNILEES